MFYKMANLYDSVDKYTLDLQINVNLFDYGCLYIAVKIMYMYSGINTL